MDFNQRTFLNAFIAVMGGTLVACGGSSGGDSTNGETPVQQDQSSSSYFRDSDSGINEIGGKIILEKTNQADKEITNVQAFWADASGNKLGNAWLDSAITSEYTVNIPENTSLPENTDSLVLYPTNKDADALDKIVIKFHDFIGNAAVSGPGGISDSYNNPTGNHPSAGDGETKEGAWYYGGKSTNDRPNILSFSSDFGGGTCVFDNGLVAVSDMANNIDPGWKVRSDAGLSNIVNEADFPAYSFLCDEANPVNTSFEVPRIKDEYGAWTYSALNDAMFYGNEVYDTFLKYLGEPPLEDKIRLRVHYGPENNYIDVVYWDGVYANLNGIVDKTKMTTLDLIAHEVGHGVLSRISHLKAFNNELSVDAHTLHEAFGDISGVIAKYEYTGELNWIHGEESKSGVRYLDRIKTEEDAIASFLDYDDAGNNYYLRIGMITYPFYLLTEKRSGPQFSDMILSD